MYQLPIEILRDVSYILLKCSYLPNLRGSSVSGGASSSWSQREGYSLPNPWYPYYMQSGQHREIHNSLKGRRSICFTYIYVSSDTEIAETLNMV